MPAAASHPESEKCASCLLPKADHAVPFTRRALPGNIRPKQACSYFVTSHTCFVCRRFTGGCCAV